MIEIRLIEPDGPVCYDEGHALQDRLVADRVAGIAPDTLLLLEHRPVITLGRFADPGGLLAEENLLRETGIDVRRVGRGGQATYHGPGQLVGYPILGLRDLGIGARTYVTRLEEVMLRTAAAFGVDAHRIGGKPGVFCAQGKIGAVGVAVRRGVSYHGFAFNVRPDLEHYRYIVPCGLTDIPPTSLAVVHPPGPDLSAVRTAVLRAFADVFEAKLVPVTLSGRSGSSRAPSAAAARPGPVGTRSG